MQLSLDAKLVTSSPHMTRARHSTRGIMLDVIVALVPAVLAAIFFFGHLVVVNLVVCCLSCVAFEYAYNLAYEKSRPSLDSWKKSSVHNLSCIVTATILALNLPAFTDVWGFHWRSDTVIYLSLDTILICMIASLFAIVVCKMLFGGLGRNFVNPAMAARVFLLVSITGAMMSLGTSPIFGADIGTNLSSGASWLGMTGDGVYNQALSGGNVFFDMFIGNTPSAAVGETSVIAIALGYLYLVFKKRIDWRSPLILIGSAAVFALLLGFGDSRINYDSASAVFGYMLAQVLSGGLVFAAVFMVTDYVDSPNTFLGGIVYFVSIAFFTVSIRIFSSWQEGVSFALLLGNILVPLIDRYIYPRPFGYVKKKKLANNNVD